MTVKEKVREIAAKYFPVGSPHYTSEVAARVDCQNAINEMAEWKDKQFDSMIINFFHLIQDGIPFERAYKQVTGKNWQKIEENEKKKEEKDKLIYCSGSCSRMPCLCFLREGF